MIHFFMASDFISLAEDYSQYRTDYCPSVLNALLGLLNKTTAEVDFVDVGAVRVSGQEWSTLLGFGR